MSSTRDNDPAAAEVSKTSRRDFLRRSTSAVVGAAALSAASLPAIVSAAGDDTLRVGLIGCGDRGSGAAMQALSADSNVVLTAMGDLFDDRLQQSLELLRKQVPHKVRVDPAKCFLGFDAHQQVIDSDVDVVLLCTPPGFRAAHLAAAVAAGKHSFVEIAAAVDAPGIRSFIASAELARQKNLAIVSGFCWRVQLSTPGRARADSTRENRRNSFPLFYLLPQPHHPQTSGTTRPEVERTGMADSRLARLHVAVRRRDHFALGSPQRRQDVVVVE